MKVLVVGGTGRVGSRAAAALRDRGVEVRVLSRNPAPGRTPAGVEVVVGDIGDPRTLMAAFRNVDRVLISAPPSPSEVEAGVNCLAAATRDEVERIVYVSAAGAESAHGMTHFERKAAIERAGRDCGVAFTVIRPVDLFQNDLSFEHEIAELGVYPVPIGDIGVSRVDVRDVADAAAAALLDPRVAGEVYTIAGPDELTGEDVAEVYERHLGRPVRYAGDDLDAWTARLLRSLPGWLAPELAEVYRRFQQHGALATDADLATVRRLIRRPLRTFEEFAAETASRRRL